MRKNTASLLASLCGFCAIILVVLLAINPLDGNERSDFLQFLGRFHPLILHLPIGFVLLLGILELLGATKSFAHVRRAVPLVLSLAIISLLSAVGTGFLLAYASGANEPRVITHMQTSIYLAIGCLVLGVVKIFESQKNMSPIYRLLLIINLALLVVASHNGGSITHGEDYLTKYMPNGLRPIFGLQKKEPQTVASKEDLIVYTDLIHPVFEQNCITCHNPEKLKGEFNMETYQSLLKGGDMGYAISPGDSEDSELYLRITLPHDDEDFMPAEGKPPFTREEVALVGWWIDEGASPDLPISEFSDIPASIQSYIDQVFDSMVSEEELEKREGERQELYAQLNQLHESLGILIIPTEPKSREFKLETFATQEHFDNSKLKQLEPFASTFVDADLSGTQLTDEAIVTLCKFENLRSLNLSKTKIRGKNIGQLATLENLQSLNLYGTPISSDHLDSLAKLKQLKHLFLFQTELYQETILAQLKEALPECDFVMN